MRIVVSGYYGAGNLGDEALLAGLLGGLRAAGATDLAVLSAQPAATRALHGVPAVSRTVGLPAALLRAGALVSGGGGLLQDATSARSLRYYLGVVGAARALGRRVVVYGQSLGPLGAAGRERVRRALTGLPLGLRDEASCELARSWGLHPVLVGDAALLLTAPAPPPHPPRRRPGVLLVPRGPYAAVTEVLADVARRAVSAGDDVAVAALHPRDDDAEVARLRARVPEAAVLTLRTPADALAAVAATRLVVSARLHGLVLAAAAGVPHLGIAYDPKVRGFAELVGAPCWDAPTDARAARDVAGALVAHLAAPPLDAARVAAARRTASDGVRWLAERLGVGADQRRGAGAR